MQNLAHLTVLAVDDDAVTLKVIQHLLKKIVKVEVRTSASEALKALQQQRIDLILSDMEMPEMSGRQLLDRVKATPGLQHIPFIFLSSIHEQDTWLASLDAGAQDFLVKPVEPSLLSAKVKAWLRPLSKNEHEIEGVKKAGVGFHLWNLVPDYEPHGWQDGIQHYRQLPKGLLPDAILYNLEDHTFQELRPIEKVIFRSVRLKIELHDGKFKLPDSRFLPISQLGAALDSMLAYKPLLHAEMQEEFRLAVKKTSILQNEQFELKIGSLRIFGLNQSYGGLAGGDFLNQIWLPDGSCLLAIGDVMGKLWGAWFVSMAYLAYFRTLVRAISMEDNKPFSLLKLMEKLNTLICRDLQLAEVFTTLCLLHINSDGSRYQLVNAGFLPRLGNLESIKRIQLQGTLLGLTYQATYEILEGTFEEGEFMVIPTDGWAESRPVQSDVLIGEEPLDRFLLETHRNGGPTIEFPELFNRHFQVDQMTDDASFLWISSSSAL